MAKFPLVSLWSSLRGRPAGLRDGTGEWPMTTALPPETPTPVETPGARAEGSITLHGACKTLLRTVADDVPSILAIVPLSEFPVPAAVLPNLAERIASEYGLRAEATVDRSYLRVRFARPSRF